MFEEALHLAKDQFSGFPTTRISVESMAYVGLGYLYSKRALYSKAEKCYQEALSKTSDSTESRSSTLRSLRSFILLNRGRSRLDDGKFQKAKEDFEEAGREPDLLPYVETDLGILYYKQSFYAKAKSKFNHAIELKSDLAEAYYNLGVVYNEEGRKEKAIRLFKAALDINGDLSEARDALEKLEGSKVQDIRDWYNWWFGKETTRYKKGLGTVFVAFILLGISSAIYDIHMTNSDISGSIFGVLGFALIFLILPLITKLKLGTIEIEMESKGERPSLYSANSVSLKSA
jgi:tetratricopeptide (TPR) repeat protein